MPFRLKNDVKAIYLLGEENEPSHDAISIECLEKISKLMENGRVNCYVQFNSQTMLSALQKVDFEDAIKEKQKVQPFNFDEIWAQKALATIPNNGYKPSALLVTGHLSCQQVYVCSCYRFDCS